MSFVERVKEILLSRNEEEIENIKLKIEELQGTHSQKRENVSRLKEESEIASKEKAAVQKNVLTKKELSELEIIYNFIANYDQIDKMIEHIRHISGIMDYMEIEGVAALNLVEDEERIHRLKLTNCLMKLNDDLPKILAGEQIEEADEKEDDPEEEIEFKDLRSNFLKRLFGRAKKKEAEASKKEEPKKLFGAKNSKNTFNNYRRTIDLYDIFYNSYIVADIDGGPQVIDKHIANITMANIRNLELAEKRGFELTEEEYAFLEDARPRELWTEISKFYSITLDVSTFIRNFARHIDRYEELYKEKPELFDVKNLEQIFADNNQLVATLRQKNKVATEKSDEVFKRRQEEKEIKAQIKELETKRAQLRAKNKKISEAKTLKELGYKNKADAVNKIGMQSLDYIVIPVPKEVLHIRDAFAEEKKVKIEIDSNTYYAAYTNDIAAGRINTLDEKADIDSVLLVPISSLKKEDIDSVRSGKINLNSSVLNGKETILMTPASKSINTVGTDVQVLEYTYDSLPRHLRSFLGEDYTKNQDETENYEIFKGIPNVSSKEKRLKKEAVKDCLMESVRKAVTQYESITVNGKSFFINKEDENEMRLQGQLKEIDEKTLRKIVSDIEAYILYDGKNNAKIDMLYQRLLTEYMRVNRKVKAEYYEEDNTMINVNGRKLSIKPTLPAKNESIARRYSRPREDIAYKAMKLAMMVNKFAHLTENEDLQNTLYDAKLELIEHAIDLANDNPMVNIKQVFDKEKMVMSVIMEIPGYNMIALHAKNKGTSLSYKANRLEVFDEKVVQSSTILIPGVNKDLLSVMKGMSEAERGKLLVDLDAETFYKLAIRMGYTSDRIGSAEDRKNFIKRMISDKKLDDLLKQTEDLEK